MGYYLLLLLFLKPDENLAGGFYKGLPYIHLLLLLLLLSSTPERERERAEKRTVAFCVLGI